MTIRRRCGVCGRVLSISLLDSTGPTQFCPDRPCFLYPPVSVSRAEDPTMAPYLATLVTCTEATPHKLAKALGMATGSDILRTVRQQEKRWSRLP